MMGRTTTTSISLSLSLSLSLFVSVEARNSGVLIIIIFMYCAFLIERKGIGGGGRRKSSRPSFVSGCAAYEIRHQVHSSGAQRRQGNTSASAAMTRSGFRVINIAAALFAFLILVLFSPMGVRAEGGASIVKVPMMNAKTRSESKVNALFERIRVDECRTKLAKALLSENGCETDRSADHSKIALMVTNCHFENSGKPVHKCPGANEGGIIKWKACIGAMSEFSFGVFTQFSLQIESICAEINLEKFQLSVESVVHELHASAMHSTEIIGEISKSSAEIIREVDASKVAVLKSTQVLQDELASGLKRLTDGLIRSVELESELIKMQRKNSDAQDEIFSKMASDQSKIFEGLHIIESTVRGWIPLFETIRDTTSSTHASLASIKAGAFYFTVLLLIWLLTARLSSTRLVCVFFFAWSISIEFFLARPLLLPVYYLCKGTSGAALTEAQRTLDIEAISWWIRLAFTAASLAVLSRAFISHLSRPRLSRQDTERILMRVGEQTDSASKTQRSLIDCLIDHIVQWRVWAIGETLQPSGRAPIDTTFTPSGRIIKLHSTPSLSPQLQKLLTRSVNGAEDESEDSDSGPQASRFAVSDAPLLHAAVRRKSSSQSPLRFRKRKQKVDSETVFAPNAHS